MKYQRGIVWLALLPYIGYGLMAAAALGGLGWGIHKYNESIKAPLVAQIKGMEKLESDRQKYAAKMNSDRKAENAKALQSYVDYARNADDDYAKKLADMRARINAGNGVRYIDPNWRSCGAGGQAGKSDPGTPEATPAQGELPRGTRDFLRAEAARADEISVYANSCYRFVNQK